MSFQSSGDRPDLSTSGRTVAQDPSAPAKWLTREVSGSRNATGSFAAESRPVSDTNLKLAGHHASFWDTGRVCLGHIMDGSAIANCYRVHVEKGQAPISAIPLSHTSNACFGATAINTYVPGTPVVVMVHDKVSHGWILGAAPALLQTGQRAYHDYISQASRKRVDDCHKRFIKLPMSGGVVDASAWRPFDQTLASEWGAITTTGCKVTLDDFMVQVAVNEMCGVWGFYHDSLLRIAGYNMQMWTAGAETEDYMDQSESFNFRGWTPYAWEGAGGQEGQTNVKEYTPDQYQCATGCPWYAHWENINDYVQGFHRTQLWHGYLGQGQRLLVQVPPVGVQSFSLEPGGDKQTPEPAYDSKIATSDGGGGESSCGGCGDASSPPSPSNTPPIVLHEDNIALDGRRFMASAKGIVIAKRMLLTPSIRRKRPDHPAGDDAETNYKSAGKHGAGPEHPITGDFKAEDEHKNLQRASAVLDLHAYLFNYAGVHAFYWHQEDFKTWEEDELTHAEYQHRVPDFNSLQGSMYLKEPEPKNINIDHRYNKNGQQNFYETTSAISLLEDGSIVISDGYGAEIKMSAGCIILSAPGDVWMKSGRHCQLWSGGDGIIRANGAVEMSTTEKSVRIKSEKDVLIMAGNKDSGGGVLIESRSSSITYDFERAGDDIQFGGVVLRAPESNVVALAQDIYLRSGANGETVNSGGITLDAGKGTAPIVTKSKNLFNYIGEDGLMANFYGLADAGDPQLAHVFEKDFVLLSGNLGLEKSIIAGEGLLCRDFIVTTGPIAAKPAVVGECSGDCEKDVNEAISKIEDYIKNIIPKAANKFHDDYLETLWYDEKRAGNDQVIEIMEFSFRTEEQYDRIIPDFMLYEDRWQQMARITGKIPKTWTETGVKSAVAGMTFPFPGKKWLEDEKAYRTQDFNLLEKVGEGFRDKKRGKDGNLDPKYREPTCEPSEPKVINGFYPIVGTP